MKITEVRIKLMERSSTRLLAFASVTFDGVLVVKDIKVIDGDRGWFIAMPCRRLTDRCPGCGHKNALQARFCNACSKPLAENRGEFDVDKGRLILFADVAHPITDAFHDELEEAILDAYEAELKNPTPQPPSGDAA